METFLKLIVTSGFANLTFGNVVMFVVAGTLIYLAITRGYEPLLLIPIGFGTILANLPLGEMGSYADGVMNFIYRNGIKTELLPPVIFMGVGVLTDFRPLLGRPLTFLLGAAAQLGIFTAALGAFYVFGFTPEEPEPEDERGAGADRHGDARRRAHVRGEERFDQPRRDEHRQHGREQVQRAPALESHRVRARPRARRDPGAQEDEAGGSRG